jgi:sn-glycerol 3-phosphate transport system permease protein
LPAINALAMAGSAPRRVYFRSGRIALLFVLPQLLILFLFFFWPAAQSVVQAFFLSDPFLGGRVFVGLENFYSLLASSEYWQSVRVTLVFSILTTALALAAGFALAVAADRFVHRVKALRSVIIWPYAVAPAIAGMLWLFMLHPAFGVFARLLEDLGLPWNPLLEGADAMVLVVVAAAWKQVSYNFVFFLAGLQAVPAHLTEAAAVDGAGPIRRLFDITLPLLSPTVFFLIVMNLIYSFFETFALIDTITQGGPGGATRLLVYKIYHDGFQGQDMGSAAAQSLVLMIFVGVLTVLQFRYVERRVVYS